jgi:CxxC-x17-CxxC domain-containing protein
VIGFLSISRKGAELSFQDRTMACRDCGQDFVWTAGEQEFYAQRGLTNEPRRCPDCRRARKSQGGGGGYDRPQRQMFAAVCSECGKETQVPFQPRGDKPVYCSDCFASRRQGSYSGRY